MIPEAGGDGLTVAEKMEIARQRSTKPFILETKIPRKEPKSDFLLRLEKRQARERMEVERKRIVVQIKGWAKK